MEMEPEPESDSDASHVSATPPRHTSHNHPSPLPIVPPVAEVPQAPPKGKRKPDPKRRKSQDSNPEADSPLLDPVDFSSLPMAIRIRAGAASDGMSGVSSSSFANSRLRSLDLSKFQSQGDGNPKFQSQGDGNPSDEAPMEADSARNQLGICDEAPLKPHGKLEPCRSRLRRPAPQLNWIAGCASDRPSEAPLMPPRRFSGGEGNFVRLNINGHFKRKPAFKNGKKRSLMYSANSKYRRRARKGRRGLAGEDDGDEEEEEVGLASNGAGHQTKSLGCSIEASEAVEAARKEPSEVNLRNLLRAVYGYDSFREGQLEAIQRVLAKESTMLLLPTGSGKSLCYQLPALLLPGITLVICPLIALMIDQLRQLPPMLHGAIISSNQTSEEVSATLDRIHEGSIKVLFISPERLSNTEFMSLLSHSIISLVVVDEAHCISEWSHNFRPSYLRLKASHLWGKLNVEGILAMTATATTQTQQEIMNALEIPKINLIGTCHMRDNLQLFVTLSGNKLKDLLMLMKSPLYVNMKSVIVYCKFQVETEIVSKHLSDNNISAKGYHSGLPSKDRSRIHESFCANKIKVVVATVAFGMGLDKSDVNAVIHYSLPESLEEYVQATGRAGRDGQLSFCHLLLDEATYFKLRSLSYSDGIDEYAVSRLLGEVFSSDNCSSRKISSLVIESTSRKFDIKEEVILTILTHLELGEVQYLLVHPQVNATCILNFHKSSPELLSNKNFLISAIIKRAEKKQGQFVFDIPSVANDAGITTGDLLNRLGNLKLLGEITYDMKDSAFCFTVIQEPVDICSLTSQLVKWLSEVERCKVWKLDKMFRVAAFAAKECNKLDGCSNNTHTYCIQNNVNDYFSSDANDQHDGFCTEMKKSSRFLQADIKVFLQTNSQLKFTPRAVARIMHGIPSPAFPSLTWSKCHFWGRYSQIDFPDVMKAASTELMTFVKKMER